MSWESLYRGTPTPLYVQPTTSLRCHWEATEIVEIAFDHLTVNVCNFLALNRKLLHKVFICITFCKVTLAHPMLENLGKYSNHLTFNFTPPPACLLCPAYLFFPARLVWEHQTKDSRVFFRCRTCVLNSKQQPAIMEVSFLLLTTINGFSSHQNLCIMVYMYITKYICITVYTYMYIRITCCNNCYQALFKFCSFHTFEQAIPYERRSNCFKVRTFPFCFQPPLSVGTVGTVQLFPGLNRLGRVNGLLPHLGPRLRMNE